MVLTTTVTSVVAGEEIHRIDSIAVRNTSGVSWNFEARVGGVVRRSIAIANNDNRTVSIPTNQRFNMNDAELRIGR